MPKKCEIKIELNPKEAALVHYEMEWGRNESIRRQARILYIAGQGTKTKTELCEKTGHDHKTVDHILKMYEQLGVDAVYQCKRGQRVNHLEQIADELTEFFDKNPPSDIPDAVRKIRENFHINITATPVRNWLKAKDIRTKSQKVYLQKLT